MIKYKKVLLKDGDYLEEGDILCAIERAADKVISGEPWLGTDHGYGVILPNQRRQLDGYRAYWVVRPIKEPEVNEFGEVVP